MNKLIYYFNLILLFLTSNAFAQQIPNWQNKELAKDSLFGISTEKAYTELLKGKPHKTVIVAVIDAGVDTSHEDLKAVLWHNPKKKAFDNGTYGWSYIGSDKGNVHYDNLELTRQVRQFENGDTLKLNSSSLQSYHAERKELNAKLKEAQQNLSGYTNFLNALQALAKQTGKENPTAADISAIRPTSQFTEFVASFMTKSNIDFAAYRKMIQDAITHFKTQADYQLNTAYDPRLLVGDDYFNSKEHNYGSPDVNGPDPTHGTHVAGIIAGIRGNGKGADGVADDVRILSIRTVPDGDERDKDVANAIRYAADHGAKVINMSFGKGYSQDKKAVDEAFAYALKKDVLLVQAAGNSNQNIDTTANFPRRVSSDEAYIVVGASGPHPDTTLKASFSNYGKTAVDVFAPGVQIYSSVPGSQYDYFDGTSMACPVVAGLAALIREYHPKLTALQVKQIIMETVVVSPYLKDRCVTGGVVNAYKALLLAESLDQ